MKYLCLIYLDEKQLDAMPADEMSALNAKHWDFNDGLRETGHFIVAEALERFLRDSGLLSPRVPATTH